MSLENPMSSGPISGAEKLAQEQKEELIEKMKIKTEQWWKTGEDKPNIEEQIELLIDAAEKNLPDTAIIQEMAEKLTRFGAEAPKKLKEQYQDVKNRFQENQYLKERMQTLKHLPKFMVGDSEKAEIEKEFNKWWGPKKPKE